MAKYVKLFQAADVKDGTNSKCPAWVCSCMCAVNAGQSDPEKRAYKWCCHATQLSSVSAAVKATFKTIQEVPSSCIEIPKIYWESSLRKLLYTEFTELSRYKLESYCWSSRLSHISMVIYHIIVLTGNTRKGIRREEYILIAWSK